MAFSPSIGSEVLAQQPLDRSETPHVALGPHRGSIGSDSSEGVALVPWLRGFGPCLPIVLNVALGPHPGSEVYPIVSVAAWRAKARVRTFESSQASSGVHLRSCSVRCSASSLEVAVIAVAAEGWLKA